VDLPHTGHVGVQGAHALWLLDLRVELALGIRHARSMDGCTDTETVTTKHGLVRVCPAVHGWR
jgi:hypothetical protein